MCKLASPRPKRVIIVTRIVEEVDELFDRRRLPPVELLRPKSCPLCGELASRPGEHRLGIVGHGTYRRQVLGVLESTSEAVTDVRRYFCRGCRHTIAVLSDHLHPRRWYAAEVILEALRLGLLERWSDAEIRAHFGIELDSGRWRSLLRWRWALLVTLWYWLAKRLGARSLPKGKSEARRRLRALIAESSGGHNPLRSTVHFEGFCWPLGHDPPGNLCQKYLEL